MLFMRPVLQKRLLFVAKSMLWSVLLYGVCMLAVNWDDVSNKIRGVHPVTIISDLSTPPNIVNPVHPAKSISLNATVIRNLAAIAHAVDNVIALIR